MKATRYQLVSLFPNFHYCLKLIGYVTYRTVPKKYIAYIYISTKCCQKCRALSDIEE